MKDPQTPEEWQEAADLAWFFLVLESCRMYGLIRGGPRANIERCESILIQAKNRGITPTNDEEERLWGTLFVSPTVSTSTRS